MIQHLAFLGFLLLSSTAIQAQDMDVPSADEIIASYLENTGGKENWKKMKSMQMDVTLNMQGMEFAGTIYKKRPNKQRTETSFQGKTLVQAYDGKTAWEINPIIMGSVEPKPMSAKRAENMTKEKFEDELIDYQQKGHRVAYLGMEEVEGTESYKIQLTKANGDVVQYFFDKEYLLPIMQRGFITEGPMSGQSVETYFGDYEEVDGMMMPFFMKTKAGGQTINAVVIKSVKLNIEMDDDLFEMPE